MDGVRTYPLTAHQIDILETRALDLELLVKLGVQGCDRPAPGSVAIPYVLDGEVVNYKFRTIAGEKRMAQVANAPKIFWNVDCLKDPTLTDNPVIIVEGEFDGVAVIQSGFSRVVSVPDGAPGQEIGDNPTSKYDYLQGFPDSESASQIILATDGDQNGINLMNDLARRLGRGRCKWVQYPKRRNGDGRCKDMNEVLQDWGQRGVVETIGRARWMAVPGLYRMSELPPLEEPRGFDVGVMGLEGYYRARLGDFGVITGIPGHGKTTLVNQVTFNLAARHKLNICYASFEQTPQREHRRNLRTIYAGKWVKHQTPDEIRRADEFIDRHFSFIVPGDDDSPTIPWFLERAKAAVLRYDSRVVVLDPWNEMDHDRPEGMSLTEYVGESIKTLKRFARNFAIHLIVAAHPAKMRRDKDGKFPIPSLYDISDSANWSNKADVGVVVHRGPENTTIRVAKARYSDIGQVGDVPMIFNDQTLTYSIADAGHGR